MKKLTITLRNGSTIERTGHHVKCERLDSTLAYSALDKDGTVISFDEISPNEFVSASIEVLDPVEEKRRAELAELVEAAYDKIRSTQIENAVRELMRRGDSVDYITNKLFDQGF